MKKFTFILSAMLVTFAFSNQILAQSICSPQCTPDPSCEENVVGNGMMCPEELPYAVINEYYDEILTVIPPSTFQGFPIISAVRLDEVQGLPPGMSWCKSQEKFDRTNPITRYCCRLSGTPTQAGVYPLTLKLTPFIYTLPQNQVTDDTSLVIVVIDPTISAESLVQKVNLYPNPAYNSFTVEAPGLESVIVSDLLGKVLIEKKLQSNRAMIDISSLQKAYYIVKIRTSKGEFVRKLMKY